MSWYKICWSALCMVSIKVEIISSLANVTLSSSISSQSLWLHPLPNCWLLESDSKSGILISVPPDMDHKLCTSYRYKWWHDFRDTCIHFHSGQSYCFQILVQCHEKVPSFSVHSEHSTFGNPEPQFSTITTLTIFLIFLSYS